MWNNANVCLGDCDIQDDLILSFSEEHSYSFIEVKFDVGGISPVGNLIHHCGEFGSGQMFRAGMHICYCVVCIH